jgi:hypothetical protein
MKAICEECNSQFTVRPAERNRGNGRFCSLSCSVKSQNRNRPKRGKAKYTYAERKKRQGEVFMLNQIAGRIRGRARQVNLPCDVTAPLLRKMWKDQKRLCWYTQREMTIGISTPKNPDMDQVSVDRIKPSKGYVKGNIVLCCRWVNSAKGQGTLKELLVRAVELVKVA